jgi:hypothetical protein
MSAYMVCRKGLWYVGRVREKDLKLTGEVSIELGD